MTPHRRRVKRTFAWIIVSPVIAGAVFGFGLLVFLIVRGFVRALPISGYVVGGIAAFALFCWAIFTLVDEDLPPPTSSRESKRPDGYSW